ncbi:putative bifunctional diguanylate cyclase/phosphodiesterase [Vibrio bivalvicida]|uniref:Diguanylate phosphodiesterase n=1 Tax=Vibrio bivalvicida TaxID=1276888 RepID=A0A177XTU8_9VIBR|nr:bifunctional diguanylate cyclase/phosphodiesterase [Vibrio bivalvicida]OAJ92037.1 hypothetical protein APB76_22015 [Vibrio bivalvicida]
MAFIKKNIWLAFYLILFLWTVATFGAVYHLYHDNYRDYAERQQNLTSLTARAFDSSLTQFKTILDIVGTYLTSFDVYAENEDTYELLSETVDLDNAIISVTLYSVDGDAIVTAPQVVGAHKNLLSQPETRETFQQALVSKNTVIGRTYYHAKLDRLIVPFRKLLMGENGSPMYVLEIAVSLKDGFHYFRTYSKTAQGRDYDIFLYREQDRFFQIAPREKIYDRSVYKYQIRQRDVDLSVAKLQRLTGLSIKEIKSSGHVVVHEVDHPERRSISAATYIDRYGLWVATEVKKRVVISSFLSQLPVIVLLYLIGIVVMFFLFRSIATNERRKQEELSYQAHHDYLTGIENLFSFDKALSSFLPTASYSVLSLNIDGFKVINDNFGNQAGDTVLKSVVYRLKECIDSEHKLYRFGGDEFVVLTNSTDETYLTRLGDRLCDTFEQPFAFRELEIELTCSVSIAVNLGGEFSGDEVKRNAELAMAVAKKARSSVIFYQERFLHEYIERSRIELALKGAIDRSELFVVYQPQVNALKELRGVEALLRWEHPELGLIPPDKFIAVAENCGFMPRLGDFVLERALSDMSQLFKDTNSQFDVAINVSVKQLNNEGFVSKVLKLVHKYKFEQRSLILEVTESVFVEDLHKITAVLGELKRHSIRVSLDDFGTGYSSLSLLKHLPICEVKIDKSFVSDMLSNDKSYSMLASVLHMSQQLGLGTVAEGVETSKEVAALRQLGCDIYQGFYFAKPMRLESLREYTGQQIHH